MCISLRHYENGKNHCLTTQLITSAYMPSCTVTLEATNGRLTAYAKTDWMPQPKHAKECGCPHEVTLACAYLEMVMVMWKFIIPGLCRLETEQRLHL